MRRILILGAALLALSSPAKAADSTVTLMTAASALGGTELLYVVQGAADRKGTPAQIATYTYSLMSGDCTVAASVITCAKINGNTFPSSGTSGGIPYWSGANAISSSAALTANLPVIGGGAGVAPSVGTRSGNTTAFVTTTGAQTSGDCVKIDASGNHVANGSACGTGTSANPTATAGPTAVNGVAATFMRSDAAPAVQLGSSSQKGIVQVDNTSITAASGVISAVPVSAVPSVQTGVNYPIVDGDRAKVIYLSNAAAQTPTLPSAATLTNSNGWFVTACNINAGIQTLTPTTSTIGGAASLAIPGGSAARPVCWNVVSDGTNYNLVPAGNNNTIFSGTMALATAAISSATCATVVTTSAPGVLTTDVVLASFNGDPTAVTGYVPLTAGMLTIVLYPTANNINAKVCNNTSGSITPGAVTLNIRANR